MGNINDTLHSGAFRDGQGRVMARYLISRAGFNQWRLWLHERGQHLTTERVGSRRTVTNLLRVIREDITGQRWKARY